MESNKNDVKNIEDRENRLAVLKLMYSNIENISENIYLGLDGDNQVIFDIYGNEYLRTRKTRHNDIRRKNNTLILYNNIKNVISLINVKNGTVKEIEGTQRNIHDIGKYIFIEPSWSYKAEIVDTYTTEIIEGGNSILTDKIYVQKITYTNMVLKYMSLHSFGYRYMIIDTINNKIKCFDIQSPFEEFQNVKHHELIATRQSKTKNGYSVRYRGSLPNFRYALALNGVALNKDGKDYEDIYKPIELRDTDTFYTFDYATKIDETRGTIKTGLIDSNGNELLEAIYDSIEYIGGNNYIITTGKRKEIFNSVANKVIISHDDAQYIIKYSELPFTEIITYTEKAFILDSKNRIFNIEDIAKYFKCSYNKSNTNIIKIDFDGYSKYVNNQLQPVEYLDTNKDVWIPMV